MKTSDFFFDLPRELIAQHPSKKRGESRLLVVDRTSGRFEHRSISDLPELLDPDTLLVLNDSRVRKARIYGTSETGGSTEFLLIEQLDGYSWKTLVNKARKQHPGKTYLFPGEVRGEITGTEEEFRILRFDFPVDDPWMERFGHVPLPPYIRREDAAEDADRYQTVYAEKPGSIAAPTAGLHFTRDLLNQLAERNIEIAWVTLHVGLGTFLPVRSEKVEEHRMHFEEYEISEKTAEAVTRAKQEKRSVTAVGTTSVRTLESAYSTSTGSLLPGRGRTDLFIYPGYRFRVVDRMLTNFHTPESTLLMLVSSFGGKERIETAYHLAVLERYRFFSYGDAMYIR